MSLAPLTVADLERWVLFGATWRIVELEDVKAVIDMCTCTGDLVERRESRDLAVITYLRAQEPHQDPDD